MTGRIEKTVFISYRRANMPWALAIFQNLKSEGYDVFFDYLSIPSGDFENIIVENIKARAHFVVILTPSALERCNEPGDWLRREIETAIDEKRNIIPLMLESFDFGSSSTTKALTGKLEKLQKYNGLRIHSDYFFEGMNRLRTQFLNVALDAVIHPISEVTKPITEEHQVAASEAKQIEEKELTAQEWYEKGYLFQEVNNLNDAIRCYTQAINNKSDFVEAYNNRGVLYRVRGNLDNAIADFNEALSVQPNLAIAYSNRGVAYRAKNDLQSALDDFDRAIHLKSDFAEAYYNRGTISSKDQGNIEQAINDFDEAIRLKPDYADAYINRGIANLLLGKLSHAAKDYETAIHLRPNDGSARSALMNIYRKMGRKIEADEQEKLARPLIAKEHEYNQACFEAICGNTDKAFELLKIGLEKKQSTKEWARQDPDLESVSNDPRFKELMRE